MLHATYYILLATCYMLHATYYMLGMTGYRNYKGYGPKKKHLLIFLPFGSKEMRPATETTKEIEMFTKIFLIWQAGNDRLQKLQRLRAKKNAPIDFFALWK